MRDRAPSWQDIIERHLVDACRWALAEDEAAGYTPDQVTFEYREHYDETELRVRFRRAGFRRSLFYGATLRASGLYEATRGVPRTVLRHYCNQAIYRVWSREYENYHMREAERRAHEALSMARTPEELRMRAEQWNYLRTHVERFHTDDLVPPVGSTATATEILERQRDMGRRLDEQMVRSFLGADREAMTETAETSAPTPEGLSIERLLEAVRLLDEARVPQTDYMAIIGGGLRNYREYMATFGHHVVFETGVGTPEAQERGMRLLRENLTPEQLASYEANKHFDVVGGKSGKTYRIHHGRQMNIRELHPTGEPKCGWCFLPQGALVEGDVMLGQKIALELFEDEALAIANRF